VAGSSAGTVSIGSFESKSLVFATDAVIYLWDFNRRLMACVALVR
jgi:hypothetical protein